jgi:hypothetical protein
MLVSGNATLYVGSNVTVSGSATIVIESGARLRLFVAGAAGDLRGRVVVNSQNALDFCYFGLPGNVSLNFLINSNLVGCIYAPNAAVVLTAGLPTDFVGSCIANSVTLNGPIQLHFDENLRRSGPLH